MAGSGFDVNPDALREAGRTFDREARALARAAGTLKTKLDGLGAPWGNDEEGQKFHHVYAPNRDKIEKAVHALALGLESINDGLKDMADNHEDADDSSASGLQDGGHGGQR